MCRFPSRDIGLETHRLRSNGKGLSSSLARLLLTNERQPPETFVFPGRAVA